MEMKKYIISIVDKTDQIAFASKLLELGSQEFHSIIGSDEDVIIVTTSDELDELSVEQVETLTEALYDDQDEVIMVHEGIGSHILKIV